VGLIAAALLTFVCALALGIALLFSKRANKPGHDPYVGWSLVVLFVIALGAFLVLGTFAFVVHGVREGFNIRN
jgi:hypothetical protein